MLGNIPIFLLVAKMAERKGDSNRDAFRVALPAMLFSSPAVGLLVGTAMANRVEPQLRVPAANANVPASPGLTVAFSPAGAAVAAPPAPPQVAQEKLPSGHQVLAGLGIPPPPRDFFPSFLGYTHKQALEFAHLMGLSVKEVKLTFTEGTGEHRGPVVKSQTPEVGAAWNKSESNVHLHFG